MSQESSDSSQPGLIFAAGDIRRRLSESLHDPKQMALSRDPEDPSASALKVRVIRFHLRDFSNYLIILGTLG